MPSAPCAMRFLPFFTTAEAREALQIQRPKSEKSVWGTSPCPRTVCHKNYGCFVSRWFHAAFLWVLRQGNRCRVQYVRRVHHLYGGEYYGAFLAGTTVLHFRQTQHQRRSLRCNVWWCAFYKDTLQVVKRRCDQYLFVVNGDTLTRLAGINFAVTSDASSAPTAWISLTAIRGNGGGVCWLSTSFAHSSSSYNDGGWHAADW